MRNLIVLTGPTQSGKSGFVHSLGLTPWHIDQGAICRLHASPSLDEEGRIGCRRHSIRRGADIAFMAVRSKMERSEFLVFEVASCEEQGSDTQVISDLLGLAEKHRYATTLVDFGTEQPRALKSLLSERIGGRKPLARLMTPDECAKRIAKISNPIIDISHAEAIVAIGDIHGNAQALETCLSQAEGRGRIAFMFTGDYINKGPNSARTLRILSEFRQRNRDCFLVSGNHEMMLENWAWRRGANRDVFAESTLCDLQNAQYSRKEARKFLSRLRDHFRFNWRGHDILLTHGGLSAPTETPGLLPGHQKRMGVGAGDTDIDRLWERNCGADGSIQIHGHRNMHGLSVDQATTSYNLEGIDSFGQVRGLVLRPAKDGVQAHGFSVPACPSTRRKRKSRA